MKPVACIAILLVAAFAVASASQSQPEQASNSPSGEYLWPLDIVDQVDYHLEEEQTQPILLDEPHHMGEQPSVELGAFEQFVPAIQPHSDSLVATSFAPPMEPEPPTITDYNNSPVDPVQPQPSVVVDSHHQPQVQPQSDSSFQGARSPSSVVVEAAHQQPHHQQPSLASYYSAPAGLIQVVGAEQQQGGVVAPKPQHQAQVVRSVEQFGQPESAALPPNYKPFGSWGLYIGGNPADGYYTNYYKALSNSVADKPQPVGGVVEQPVVGMKPAVVSQTAALSPVLRQASSSPYVGGDYYPFAYSPSDLNSAARVAVDPIHSAAPMPALSPVQAGAQVYGSPAVFDTNSYGVSAYADAYATKKVGAAYASKEAPREVQVQQPAKGYHQSRVYVYPSVGQMASPAQVVGHHQQVHQSPQVVAYPVPIGSQIVGSQSGVEGAFAPYGVHAFTRYAVKPTVVSQDSSYYYGVQQPTYRQQHAYPAQPSGASYYPLGYYGYPMSQLHYSQGSLFPASPAQDGEPNNVPVQPQGDSVFVSGVEKAEFEADKNKQQKKA